MSKRLHVYYFILKTMEKEVHQGENCPARMDEEQLFAMMELEFFSILTFSSSNATMDPTRSPTATHKEIMMELFKKKCRDFESEDEILRKKYFELFEKKYLDILPTSEYRDLLNRTQMDWNSHKSIRFILYREEGYIFPVEEIRLNVNLTDPRNRWRRVAPSRRPTGNRVGRPTLKVVDEETEKRHEKERVLLMNNVSLQEEIIHRARRSGYQLLERQLQAIKDSPFYDLIRSSTVVELTDSEIDAESIVRARRRIAEDARREKEKTGVTMF